MITALMKHPRFFYVKSSGNQQMRLTSTLIEMQYHQINLMDSIRKILLGFSWQSYRLRDTFIDLYTLYTKKK